MLYAFGFGRVGVVLSDLYFVDPNPEPGQEGPEQGVRLEVRFIAPGELQGSIYSARPIVIDRLIWRADLLESAASPGSLDRAHYHPGSRGWEPGRRRFSDDMSADPVAWVGERLSDLDGLLAEVGMSSDDAAPSDAADLRSAVPEIVEAVRRSLDRVRAREHPLPPEGSAPTARPAVVRTGWL